MRLPRGWVKFLSTLKNNYIFASEQHVDEVTTFACEAKCTVQAAASRQLTLDLCSTQHQRRALCFDDRPMYGATIVGDCLVMHSSEWVEDNVVSVTVLFVQLVLNSYKMVYPLGPYFDLGTFPGFVECYISLCKVADHIAEGVSKDFQRWESEDAESKHQKALYAKSNGLPWRQEFKPKPSRKGLHTSDSGSGSVQGETECIETEDWELTREGLESKCPSLVTEGDRLVRASLQVFDGAYEADLDGDSIPSRNEIRQWAQTIADHSSSSFSVVL